MAVLEILTYPDERLKQESVPVTVFDDELRARVADLEETRLAGPGAVGIAAPQVAWFERVVIVDVSKLKKPVPNHGHLVLVYSEISECVGLAVGRVGCTSVTVFSGIVIRACAIRREYPPPRYC